MMRGRRLFLCVVAWFLGTGLSHVVYGEPLRIAVVPPQDFAPTLGRIRALSEQLHVDVTQLTPEQLVDASTFGPEQFPLAVYAGGERYCFRVHTPGDGADAVLRYVRDGGVLLVAGLCWPFYRPVDYLDGEWCPSAGELPDFEGETDHALRSRMKRLEQTAAGNLNRFLGLNIAGQGTRQFEMPAETIALLAAETLPACFELPARTVFPSDGDRRYRPVSLFHGMDAVSIHPLLFAVGDSGTEYGAAAAVVRHADGGTVVYVWGTLMDGPLGGPLLDGALRLAAREISLDRTEQQQLQDIEAAMQALHPRLDALRDGLRQLDRQFPASRYLVLQAGRIDDLRARAERATMVYQLAQAQSLLDQAGSLADRLQREITALTTATR